MSSNGDAPPGDVAVAAPGVNMVQERGDAAPLTVGGLAVGGDIGVSVTAATDAEVRNHKLLSASELRPTFSFSSWAGGTSGCCFEF